MIKLQTLFLEMEEKKKALILRRIPHLKDDNIQLAIQNDPEYPQINFVQVDDMSGGQNHFSSNPEDLIALGYDMPSTEELLKLPQGRYWLSDAKKMLSKH